MNLSDLPIDKQVTIADTANIRVTAKRISPQNAFFSWIIPTSSEEVLRTVVNVKTGYTKIEYFSSSYWSIYIDDIQKTSDDLRKYIGLSLSVNANPNEKKMVITTQVHHYTNIDTFALILKNKTIRFNRLDRVDDISEAESFGNPNLASFLFVSCWTDSALESIPQWNMYSEGMKGVRITFPKNLFNYCPLKPPEAAKEIVKGKVLSPIPFEKIFTDDYIILLNIMNRDEFERKVKYVDDISVVYKDAIDIKRNLSGAVEIKIEKVYNLASYKSKAWEFQSELRFVLLIFPALPIPSGGIVNDKYLKTLPNHIIKSILHNIPPIINFYDVEINPDVLDRIEVTMGPLASKDDIKRVQSLLDEYTTQGSLQLSSLTGTIRNPKR